MSLERDLSAVLNQHCQENASGTPDWILANYLLDCLKAYNTAVRARQQSKGQSVLVPSVWTEPPDDRPITTEVTSTASENAPVWYYLEKKLP